MLHAGFLWLQRAGLLSRCGVRASHRHRVSSCRAQALGHTGFRSCATRAQLSQGVWDLPTRAQLSQGVWDLPTRAQLSQGVWDLSTRAQLSQGVWDLPGPGIEPVSHSFADLILIQCTTREILYPLFYRLFSHIDHYRALSRVPCVTR